MVALFPGAFDPVTHGHIDIVQRASKLYHLLIVAVGNNPEKEELFSAIIQFKCAIHELTCDLFDKQRPVHDVLRELAEHFTDLLMSKEAISVFRLSIADTAKNEYSKVAQLFWEAGPKSLTQHFCRYLEEQNQMGTLHIDNPHFAAQQFLYMIKAEAYLMRALGQEDNQNLADLPQYINSCVAMFEKAYLE